MFNTLTLTIQKKINGKYTKTYRYITNDFKNFQTECNKDQQGDFKGLGCIIQANTEELHLIFVGNSVDYLTRLQQELKTIIQRRENRHNEKLVYNFIFGKIIQNAFKNL